MKHPKLAADIIIRYKGGIVLIKRKYKPYGWAIPGGYVEYGEPVEKAAAREANEETNLKLRNLKQFHVYSDPKRDPRRHTISVVFTANGFGKLRIMDETKEIGVFKKDKIPKLVFDHEKILNDYFKQRKFHQITF
jgi:8-oxo-dGTP diphosphatase